MRTPEDAPTDVDKLIRLGTIATVDVDAGLCTVTLDSGAATPPVRWLERRSGATRTRSVPSVGEQCLLLAPAGEIAGAIAIPGVWSTANPLPGTATIELAEFIDGAVVSYDPVAHALVVNLAAAATVQITAPGGITIDGEVLINGSLAVSDNVLVDNGASGTFMSIDGLNITVQDGIVTNIF